MMADARMNIVIVAVNEAQKVLEDAAAKISALGKGLETLGITSAKKASDGLTEVEKAAKKTEEANKKLHESVEKLHNGFEKLERLVKLAAGGFLAFEGVRIIKDFADVAARAETLQLVLGVVGRNAGYTAKQLDDTDRAVQKLGITASASRQSLSQFIQSGLDVAKAGELARTAQNLAVIAGENSSQTFTKMVGAIQTLDTLSLRFMGITVDNQRAQEMYALTLGRSAASLTEVEKRTALLNAVQLEATKIGDIYSESMTSVGKQLQSLERYIEEAKKALGDNLLPAYLAIVEEFRDFLHHIELVGDKLDEQGLGAEKLAGLIGGLAHAFFRLIEILMDNWKWIVTLAGAYYGAHLAVSLFTAVTAAFKAGGMVAEIMSIAKAGLVMNATLTAGIGVVLGLLGAWYAVSELEKMMKPGAGSSETENLNANQMDQLLHKKIEESKAIKRKMDNTKDKESEEYKEDEKAYEKSIKDRQAVQKDLVKKQHQWELQLAAEQDQTKRAYLMTQLADAKRNAEEFARHGKEVTARQNRDIDIQMAGKALGLDKFSIVDGGVFSQGSAAAVAGFGKMLEDFANKATTASGLVSVSFTKIRQGLLAMVAEAKTVDDFTAVLTALGNSAEKMDHLKTTIAELARTAWANREKAEAKELATIMGGYHDKLKEIQTVQNLMLTTTQLAYKGQMDLLKVEAEIAFDKKGQYAATRAALVAEGEMKRTIYERDLASVNATEGRGAAVILEKKFTTEKTLTKEHQEALKNIEANYNSEVMKQGADVEYLKRQRRASERNANQHSEEERAKLNKGIERQILDNHNENQKKRLDLAQKYYQELQKSASAYLADYRTHSMEVLNIENKIRDTRERFNSDVRNMNRSVMSDAAARADKEKEIQELEEKGRAAEKAGRRELAEKYYEKQYSMAQSLASDPGLNPYEAKARSANEMERATRNLMGVEEAQKAIRAEAATKVQQNYDETIGKLKTMEDIVQGLGKEQIVRITPELNSNTLWSEVEKIHDKFAKGLDVSLKLAAGAAKTIYEEVQALFTTNPIQVAARGAMGTLGAMVGTVGGGTGYAAAAAGGGGVSEHIALDLTYNNTRVGIFSGSKSDVNGLVAVLKDSMRAG
jgi:hypothetical protein